MTFLSRRPQSLLSGAFIASLGLILTVSSGVADAQPSSEPTPAEYIMVNDEVKALEADEGHPDSERASQAVELVKSKQLSSFREKLNSTLAERLRSLVGLCCMIGIAWLLSTHRSQVQWRLVGMGVALQVALALFTRTSIGAAFFSAFNRVTVALLDYTSAGTRLLFGELSVPGHSSSLAFGVLPTIIVFSALMALLYHLGIMSKVVQGVAFLVQKALGTSGAETLSAAGNIFVGQTEAPLLVRPYLRDMTRSELMAVMTGGFATVAGGVMVAYIGMLQGVFPDVAGHLLSASIMSAPAALVVAKIMMPETETPMTMGGVDAVPPTPDTNALDAISRGISEGLLLTLNVAAMLLGFTALVAMANGTLGAVISSLGFDPISFEQILGWCFAPFAYLMGVSWEDAAQVGSLLGVKTILNEFLAYLRLVEITDSLAPRSVVIASYALCGFANFASIGIQLGGLSHLVPERRKDLASIAFRAMVGGLLAGFMTACVVGFIL